MNKSDSYFRELDQQSGRELDAHSLRVTQRLEQRCSICLKPTPKLGDRCTNQVCMSCHGKFCTAVGNDSPGHHLSFAVAEAERQRLAKERAR